MWKREDLNLPAQMAMQLRCYAATDEGTQAARSEGSAEREREVEGKTRGEDTWKVDSRKGQV